MVLIEHLKRRRNIKNVDKKADKKSEKAAKKLSKLVKSKSNNELTTLEKGSPGSFDNSTGDRNIQAHSMAFVICDSDQEEDVVIVHSLDNTVDTVNTSQCCGELCGESRLMLK